MICLLLVRRDSSSFEVLREGFAVPPCCCVEAFGLLVKRVSVRDPRSADYLHMRGDHAIVWLRSWKSETTRPSFEKIRNESGHFCCYGALPTDMSPGKYRGCSFDGQPTVG